MRFPAHLLIAAALIPTTACSLSAESHGSGTVVPESGSGNARTFAASGFDSVGLAGPDDVQVTVGPNFSVRAQGDPAVLDKLELRRDGKDLNIGRKPHTRSDNERHKVKVFVTMPSMAAASIAGSGEMVVDRVSGRNFSAAMAGSGALHVGRVETAASDVSIAGSGQITTAGQVDKLTLSIAGSGSLDAAGLQAKRAEVSIMGSGNARATVNGPATVTIMGSGDADLGANSHCSITKMGSGHVRCGN